MKQTKPYGRAYLPAASIALSAAAEPEGEPSTILEVHPAGVELFSLGAGHLPPTPQAPAAPWRKAARDAFSLVLLLVVALVIYVGMRDSLMLANLLQQVSTEDTVMVCKDGKVQYADNSLADRLLDRGHFVCTEWKVQPTFMRLPR
jgi:hypothetical protein